ncbi:ATP-binding cassette domain-containing protein [Kaistia defluvii]|uniref:ABC transporter ATP-binding protein n=1 Tax=Kaistia defluvii TaxID=410841 RepID=UPI00224DA9A3|nr:ATP-binding cassette domain-containing protein [Kaistia defluvii]MCX5517004.1 ATP-binding cassette domain-containing protein [Kaistia defluvii]
MSALTLQNVTKRFGSTDVIRGVDLEVAEGEFVVFVGPSGCGKSTLLRIIAGLEDQTSGHVTIAGKNVDVTPPAKRGIAMVFQSYALYPHLTVKGNMGLALKQEGVEKSEIERRIAAAAKMLHLDTLLDRRPSELSGGQRQRVAIGRAIVRQPKLFLFDEPLSNLDAALRVNTRIEIANLHRLLGGTMIYVTHDQVEAMTLADKIVVLSAGKIEQVGRPIDLYNKPANLFVAGFIGSPKMNFLTGAPAEKLGATTIGIRPEHVRIVPTGGNWEGKVSHLEKLGSDTFVYVAVEGADMVTVRIVGQEDFEVGATVGLAADEAHIHRFDKDGRAI